MRKTLLLLFIIPTTAFSQKIKIESEIDKFTKERRISTSEAAIFFDLFSSMSAHYRSVGSSYFLTLSGSGVAVGVIGENDKLIFLFDNDSTISLTPTGIQTYEVGSGVTSGSTRTYYRHQYYVYKEDLLMLSSHNLKSVRRYYNNNYADIDVNEKRKDDLKNLTTAFLKEIEKN